MAVKAKTTLLGIPASEMQNGQLAEILGGGSRTGQIVMRLNRGYSQSYDTWQILGETPGNSWSSPPSFRVRPLEAGEEIVVC